MTGQRDRGDWVSGKELRNPLPERHRIEMERLHVLIELFRVSEEIRGGAMTAAIQTDIYNAYQRVRQGLPNE